MTCLFRFRYQLAAMSLLARGRAITMNILSGKKISVARASHFLRYGDAWWRSKNSCKPHVVRVPLARTVRLYGPDQCGSRSNK